MPATLSSKRLLTPAEAAVHLGWNVRSVHRACREGRIRSKKIGGRVFIPAEEVTVPVETTPAGEAA